ncbi:methanobactin export MATE transporter MbnM [Methylosinus sporium]|uniref:methanobactin export MATE transporter MbnM n=1 Tax=Methylosinus sporium TaxID=428 RepID=UPI0034D561ED
MACGTLGLCLYPWAARWFAGDNDVVALIDSGIFWYSLAAPFRFLSGASAFVLHALGDGALAVRWKLAEFVVKVVGNFILMDVIGLGFSGCFTSGAIIAIVSSIWCLRIFSANHAGWIRLPGQLGTLRFVRSTLWESQRLIAVQLSALLCLALFAAPWLGRYDVSRLNSYAAGQTFMVLLFAPFMAMMRFLAFRFLSLPEGRRVAAMRAIWAQGAPFAISAALLLLTNHEALGRLYGQQGPWWSSFVEVLAISLPLRYATNVLRALMHSRGAFAVVASADSAAFWLLAIPLVAIGLYADEPVVAYLSLILPEAASAALLWNRLPLSRPPDLAGYGDEAISTPWKGDARDA